MLKISDNEMELGIITIVVIIVIVIVFAAVITYFCMRYSKRRVSGGLRTDVGEENGSHINDLVSCLTNNINHHTFKIHEHMPRELVTFKKEIKKPDEQDDLLYDDLRRIYCNFVTKFTNKMNLTVNALLDIIDAVAHMKFFINREIEIVGVTCSVPDLFHEFNIRLIGDGDSARTYIFKIYDGKYRHLYPYMKDFYMNNYGNKSAHYIPYVYSSSFHNHNATVYQHLPLWFITEPYKHIKLDTILTGDNLGIYFVTMYKFAKLLQQNQLEFANWTFIDMGVTESSMIVLTNVGVCNEKMCTTLHMRTKNKTHHINDIMMYSILCEIYCIMLSDGDFDKYMSNTKMLSEFDDPNIICKRITQLPLYVKCFDPPANEQFNELRSIYFSWVK